MASKIDDLQKDICCQVDELLEKYLDGNDGRFEEIKSKIISIVGDAKDTTEKNLKQVDNYVSDHHWKSVLIAALVGLIGGIVISKK